mmetsp:Transcript_36829/g.93368  ORF Transcript_36829/g.93368 Transcript_36829/m.93368 type:complete len:339 (-) Transcript_36829:110-1126(-)
MLVRLPLLLWLLTRGALPGELRATRRVGGQERERREHGPVDAGAHQALPQVPRARREERRLQLDRVPLRPPVLLLLPVHRAEPPQRRVQRAALGRGGGRQVGARVLHALLRPVARPLRVAEARGPAARARARADGRAHALRGGAARALGGAAPGRGRRGPRRLQAGPQVHLPARFLHGARRGEGALRRPAGAARGPDRAPLCRARGARGRVGHAPGEGRRLRRAPAAARAPRLGGTAAPAPPARGHRGRAARPRRRPSIRPSTPERARRCATAARAAARRRRRGLVERPDRRLKERREGGRVQGGRERRGQTPGISRPTVVHSAPRTQYQCDWHRRTV